MMSVLNDKEIATAIGTDRLLASEHAFARAIEAAVLNKLADEIELLRQKLSVSENLRKGVEFGMDCADAEAVRLRQQLAASQADVRLLRCHLEVIAGKRMCVDNCLGNVDIAELALAMPQDTTALSALIAKAGEVMREQCLDDCDECREAIRALPGVTLEDLNA